MPIHAIDPLEGQSFALLGEPLAVDLVNTVAQAATGPVDLLASAAQRDAWMAAHPQLRPGPGAGKPSLEQLRALRRALAGLFAAVLEDDRPADRDVELLNELSARAAEYDQLVWPDTRDPHRQVAIIAANAADSVLAAIAQSGIEILTGPERARLRRCQGPGCVLIFVAEHPRRRWCSSATCGNRVRVARHYRRQRGTQR